MKFLALERENPGVSSAAYGPLLKPEARHAWELYQAGIIREMYFDAAQHTAVILLECESKAAAEETLSHLPLVSGGLITFEVIELTPYNGFARLFEKESSAS